MTAEENRDPFAIVAEEQITSPVRRQMRAAKTREERRIAKQQSDKEILQQQWRKQHLARIKKLKTGHYAKAVNDVAIFLETMTLEDGGRLISLIERESWREADDETRYLLLGLIDERIMFLRVNEGWAPFDDSLPFTNEAPTAFEVVRELLS